MNEDVARSAGFVQLLRWHPSRKLHRPSGSTGNVEEGHAVIVKGERSLARSPKTSRTVLPAERRCGGIPARGGIVDVRRHGVLRDGESPRPFLTLIENP
jgi:hypothetical protein